MADRLLVSGGAPPKGFMKTHGATDTTDMLEAEAIKADFHAAVSEAATCEPDQRMVCFSLRQCSKISKNNAAVLALSAAWQ
jgi:hypothetical protein